MLDWKLPSLSRPEYLPRDAPMNADSALQFYSTKLGLNNSLKRVTPETNFSNRSTETFTPTNAPAAFTDPPIVRSYVWSDKDFLNSSKKRRWTQSKSKCAACLNFGALIPILIIWQTSSSSRSSTSTSATSSASNAVLTGSSLSAFTFIPQCSSYYCEEQVFFLTNMTTTAFSLVITVQQTGNVTYHGAFNTYNTVINQTYTVTATQIIYNFFFQSGQLPAGNYTCAAQFSLANVNHSTSTDTYSVSTTNICGIVSSTSGGF